MSAFRLRPAQESDSDAIHALIRETRINPMGLDWRRFVVAETADGAFVACGQLKPHNDGTLELSSIAVQKSFRGQGAARAVIEHLLAESPRPLYLTCMDRLQSLYEKFEFRVLGDEHLPPYFRRLTRVFRVARRMSLNTIQGKLIVMRLD